MPADSLFLKLPGMVIACKVVTKPLLNLNPSKAA